MPAWCVPVSVSIHENGEEKKKIEREAESNCRQAYDAPEAATGVSLKNDWKHVTTVKQEVMLP